MSLHRLGREKKKNIENKVTAFKKVKSLKRQSYRLKEIKKNKPHKKWKVHKELDSVYCVFFEFLTVKELNTKRHFIVCSAKLN